MSILTLDIWSGQVKALYRDDMLSKAHARASALEIDKIFISHDPSIRGKNKIAQAITESLPEETEGLFGEEMAVVVVSGPTGESFKEWVGAVVDAIDKHGHEFYVFMSVSSMGKGDYPAPLKKIAQERKGDVAHHDYMLDLDNISTAARQLESMMSDLGLIATEKQMGYLLHKTDLDPRPLSEALTSIVAAAQSREDKKVLNSLVKEVAQQHIGLSTVFDFDEIAQTGNESKVVDFVCRILAQKDATSLCLQLLSAAENKNRAMILLADGHSRSEVARRTSYTKADGSTWQMSDKQLGFLSQRAHRSHMDLYSNLLAASQKALIAIKGGSGYEMGRDSIMLTYARDVAQAHAQSS